MSSKSSALICIRSKLLQNKQQHASASCPYGSLNDGVQLNLFQLTKTRFYVGIDNYPHKN